MVSFCSPDASEEQLANWGVFISRSLALAVGEGKTQKSNDYRANKLRQVFCSQPLKKKFLSVLLSMRKEPSHGLELRIQIDFFE